MQLTYALINHSILGMKLVCRWTGNTKHSYLSFRCINFIKIILLCHKNVMQNLDANYVKLSSRIFVPMDWPVGRFKKLLLSLAKKVIDDVVSDQIIVLQVNRVPTTLARYQDESRAYYVFEKVRDQ